MHVYVRFGDKTVLTSPAVILQPATLGTTESYQDSLPCLSETHRTFIILQWFRGIWGRPDCLLNPRRRIKGSVVYDKPTGNCVTMCWGDEPERCLETAASPDCLEPHCSQHTTSEHTWGTWRAEKTVQSTELYTCIWKYVKKDEGNWRKEEKKPEPGRHTHTHAKLFHTLCSFSTWLSNSWNDAGKLLQKRMFRWEALSKQH